MTTLVRGVTRYVAIAAVIALAACSQPEPPPQSPAVSPTPAATLQAQDNAICSGLDRELCEEVLTAAVHNLAWSRSSFVGPGTVATAECPQRLPDDFADDTPCWHVALPLRMGMTPQVVMARRVDGVVAQAGGDAISGQAQAPGDDNMGTIETCVPAAEGYSGVVVAAFDSTIAAMRRLPTVAGNAQVDEYADDEPATLCYIDGQIAKSPPPDPSGTPRPSFDRAVLVVIGGEEIFVAAGYRERFLVQAP